MRYYQIAGDNNGFNIYWNNGFIVMVQEFLMLEEIIKNNPSLAQEKEKNASVEIQNLTCYWDKVQDNFLSLPGKAGFYPVEF